MQLNISARHLDLTPALSDYVHRKVEKAQRFFDHIIWAQVVLAVEKHRHIAEIVVHLPGETFRAKEEAGDLYSAIDLAAHKLDLHLSRVKEKKRNHHHKENSHSAEVLSMPRPTEPGLVEEFNRVDLEPVSLSQAIKTLDSNGLPCYPFINERTNAINVVYRKGKKRYGLMEAEE